VTNADNLSDVTEDEAFANVLEVFPDARIAGIEIVSVVKPASAEANTAYRAGLCIDCRTRPYSHGRPRCEECHRAWINQKGNHA
jgi:hypothetical protein